MKAGVCFTPHSFDFDLNQADVHKSLNAASELIGKMSKGFVRFFKSSDFDSYAAEKVYQNPASLDAGAVMSLLYDQQMNKAIKIQLNQENVNVEVNKIPPLYEDTWLSVYLSDPGGSQAYTVISSEKSLVDYCSNILVNNPCSHAEYAKKFVEIYNNLLFLESEDHSLHPSFDSIRKMDGGYGNFIRGITACLSYMNEYVVITHDSQKNIERLNAHLEFPVTPEGKGKNKRRIQALKRDFFINGEVYPGINCEYHYKLERCDGANGGGTYYFNRIYFGFFNRIDPNNPKIAIAHIGEHL